MTSGEQNAQFPVGSARAGLRRRECLINFLYYFTARGIGLGARAGDLEGDGALPLLHHGPWPRLNADRPRHDEGTTTWGHDRGGSNRGTSVSEGITMKTKQAKVLGAARQGNNGT